MVQHAAANLELGQRGRTADLAFITRRPLGFGQIIFVGFDLHAPPFDTWLGRGKFLEKLLKRRPLAAQRQATSGANLTKHLGYVDLSGQFRSALDQFAGVRLVPFWAVALLTIGYIGVLVSAELFGRWPLAQASLPGMDDFPFRSALCFAARPTP